MDQSQMIAKLMPAIALRRQLDPRANPKSAVYADPVLEIRPLQPSERAFSDETLDTILIEHEIDADHAQPCGLIAASSSAIALTWFPGQAPTAIRLLATGISVLTGRPTTYVQIFAGTEEQIVAAVTTAKNAGTWTDRDLAN